MKRRDRVRHVSVLPDGGRTLVRWRLEEVEAVPS